MCWSRKGRAWRTRSARSVSAKCLRDELLDGEIFYTLRESSDRHRELAAPLQRCQAARFARLQTAGTAGVRASIRDRRTVDPFDEDIVALAKKISSLLPSRLAAMAISGSRPCCEPPDGW